MESRRKVLSRNCGLALVLILLFARLATAGVVGPYQLGGAGYEAVPADYDGDGKTDPAVYQESTGLWGAGLSSNGYQLAILSLGGPGWLPAPGDYDGDGKADLAVYHASTYMWWAKLSGSQYQLAQAVFGDAGYVPAPGDYDGDGKADLTLYQATQGAWYTQPSSDPGAVTVGTAGAFRATMEQDGLTVQAGSLTNLNVLALFNAGILPSCYAYNNDSPYLVIIAPPAPGQTASNMLPWTFRLREDEALVWVGKTPPETVYYSIQPFLALRYVPTANARKRIYCNVGDTVNNFTIHSTGTPNGNAGNEFGQDAIFIFAANQGVEARVRAAARAAGYSASIMNTLVLPSSILNLGVGESDDEFQVLMRTAFFTDTNAANAYISNPPVTVFRVTPATPATPDPYPMPTLRVRGSGVTEMDYNGTLDDLRDAILAKYPDCTYTQLVTSVWLVNSLSAIQENVDLLGETRDTVYLRTEDFSLTNNEFVVVYGVNHALSGKATYANVNVYGNTPVAGTDGQKELAGVASINSVSHFPGTVEDYIPGHADAGKFYAYKVAWSNSSGDPHCLVIPPPTGRLTLRILFLGFRAYIEPDRNVGTASEELLFDRAIIFRPN